MGTVTFPRTKIYFRIILWIKITRFMVPVDFYLYIAKMDYCCFSRGIGVLCTDFVFKSSDFM